MGLKLTKTFIVIDKAEIDFSNLSINQYLADVGSFSFAWRQPRNKNMELFQEYVQFYQQNLSKSVEITIAEGEQVDASFDIMFTFKGFIYAISCIGQDDMGTEYSVSGKGIFAKMDEVKECKSFYKKTIKAIVEAVNESISAPFQSTPSHDGELFYTVQYNQTNFEFISQLAMRYGEWLYYDGNQMIMAPPGKNGIPLKMDVDILDVQLSARIAKPSGNNVGFDVYTGKALTDNKIAPAIRQQFIQASIDGGKKAFGEKQTGTYVHTAATQDGLSAIAKTQQNATMSNMMYLTGRSSNGRLALAGNINLQDKGGTSVGNYIIVQINHFCASKSQYQNSFSAVPAEINMPPYANSQLYPSCKPQPAIVTDNEDDKGMGRIKVHFPWQQDKENTPWLSVMVPHAGKDKGFLFLPEKGEQVMVDFINGNAERPYVVGAFYTNDGDHGNDHTNNNIKVIGTKSGRRLEINDEEGFLSLADNYTGKTPKNIIYQKRTNEDTAMKLASHKSDEEKSYIHLVNEESIEIALFSAGEDITKIFLEKNGEKITIHSKGSINISADQEINISAGNVNINASQTLNLSAGEKGKVNIEGIEIKAEAKTNMDLKALNTTVKGDAQVEVAGALANLKADGITTIKGEMVMIN